MDGFVRQYHEGIREPSRREFRNMAADSLATVLGRSLPMFMSTGKDEVKRVLKEKMVGWSFNDDDYDLIWKRLAQLATRQVNREAVLGR